MAATAKKLGQAGLAQLGRLTRRSKHGDTGTGQGEQREGQSGSYKRHLAVEESSSTVSSEEMSSESCLGTPWLKSSSMCNVATIEPSDLHQADINDLTQRVKAFLDALSSLKELFTSPTVEPDADLHVIAHERLGDVVSILRSVLTEYQSLNSKDVFFSASELIAKIKALQDRDVVDGVENQAVSENIDQLALAFSTSVSDYLMGDNSGDITLLPARTKSYENLGMTLKDSSIHHDGTHKSAMRIPHNIDDVLSQMDIGVDVALQRAKSWAKYAKDIMTYVDRKAHYESEFAKNLSRLANSMRPAIVEEGFLPLQDEYFTSMENDLAFASNYQATASALLAHKFIEPLNGRRSDHEKVRKACKDQWNKEVKRMEQAVNSLKNAKTMYAQRRQEYERACELSQKTESEMLGQSGGTATSKIEKKRKAEEDAMHKAAEAETTYKACVAEANMRQVEIARVKREVLARIHEQIVFGDKVLKKVTRDYFQLEHTTNTPVPPNYYDLYEKSELYEPGTQYAQFVGHLTPSALSPVFSEQFIFEPYQSERRHLPRRFRSRSGPNTPVANANRKTSNHSTSSLGSAGQSHNNSPQATNKAGHRPLVRAWSHTMGSDSESASSSNKSMDSSPSASPLADLKTSHKERHSMSDVLEEDVLNDSGLGADGTKGKRESSDFVGICKRLGNRRGTFGVDFSEQVRSLQTDVPPIVTQCLLEIELRGITCKGIYRVSGVKSKVESLCDKFDNARGVVDIRDENPIVVSNVLKLYLRQLPEPLMTFALYPDFIRIAREDMSGKVARSSTIEQLNELVSHLPQSNFQTCAVLMHHLKRVTHHIEENSMNANNLGIVFGPTLLRPRDGPMTALVDTPHQTCAVELLISAAQEVFGPQENFKLIAPDDISQATHTPLTTSYTDTISTPPVDGHRALRRSSSTPIGEVSFSEFASKAPDDPHPDTDEDSDAENGEDWVAILPSITQVCPLLMSEMRDMVSRRHDAARQRTDDATSTTTDTKPVDPLIRLAKSVDIKAKFLLGSEGETKTGGDVVIGEPVTLMVTDTRDKHEKSDYLTEPVKSKPARPLSASNLDAKAMFLLGSAAEVDNKHDVKHDTKVSTVRKRPVKQAVITQDINSTTSPVVAVQSTPPLTHHTPTVPHHTPATVTQSVPPRLYQEIETSEISMIPTAKCILTVPRPYPGLSSSPTPAPKLRLPPGSITPTTSPVMPRAPSSKFTELSSNPHPHSQPKESRADFISSNVARMSLIDDGQQFSDDDDISFV